MKRIVGTSRLRFALAPCPGRFFLCAVLLSASAFPGEDGSTRPSGSAPTEEVLTRAKVLERLREPARKLLAELETKTGLQVVFQSLPRSSYVIAQYSFDPPSNTPTVLLRSGWKDADVAHELTHMQLDLVEGYRVLAWRRDVAHTKELEAAIGRVRSYVDDQVVHARLARAGYKMDGEVLSPVFFEDICTNIPRYLDEGRARPNDGMAHLDKEGYGDLCRSTFLVQMELVVEHYSDSMPAERLKLVKQFITAFRAHRAREAEKADKILALFRRYDVQTLTGHERILKEWSEMEGLDRFVGLSAYVRRDGKFTLPFP